MNFFGLKLKNFKFIFYFIFIILLFSLFIIYYFYYLLILFFYYIMSLEKKKFLFPLLFAMSHHVTLHQNITSY